MDSIFHIIVSLIFGKIKNPVNRNVVFSLVSDVDII